MGMAKALPTPWSCVPGVPLHFATAVFRLSSTGVPECASADGKTCIRALPRLPGDPPPAPPTCQLLAAQLNGKVLAARVTLVPLRCGEAHARVWGSTGFDQAGHWCLAARQHLHDTQPGELRTSRDQAGSERGAAVHEHVYTASRPMAACYAVHAMGLGAASNQQGLGFRVFQPTSPGPADC
jgi:hypothetical protein